MKLSAPVLKTLLMTASLGMVVPMIAQTTPRPPVRSPGPDEPENEPVLPGVSVQRGDAWLALSVEGGRFRLGFYDAKKKPMPVTAARASVRWNPVNKTGESRAVLNPDASGTALVGNQPVRPPYVFKVYLALLDADGNAVDQLVIDLRDPPAPAG